MTFHEAGLHILERTGRPLHYQEIAALAIQEGLLSHVGQIPEQTMRDRLLALARRSSDRRLMVVGPGQFALTDWALQEDAEALAELEAAETAPDEGRPLRGRERHPAPLKPTSRASSSRTPAREREEGAPAGKRGKRLLPPLSGVASDVLLEAGPLAIGDLLERARQKGLVSEDLTRETLLNAIHEDNRRRAKFGKKPAFDVGQGDLIALVPGASPPVSAHRDEAPVDSGAPRPASRSGLSAQTLESRRNVARNLRRFLQDLNVAALEKVVAALLERSGYRDVRPWTAPKAAEGEGEAPREAALYIARRKLGLTELRFAFQVAPLGSEVQREQVRDLRKQMLAANAHAGLILGPAEASRDARAESQLVGQPLVSLLCAEAFTEELILRQVGVVSYEQFAVDETFWRGPRRSSPSLREGDPPPARSRGRRASVPNGTGSRSVEVAPQASPEKAPAQPIAAESPPEVPVTISEAAAPTEQQQASPAPDSSASLETAGPSPTPTAPSDPVSKPEG